MARAVPHLLCSLGYLERLTLTSRVWHKSKDRAKSAVRVPLGFEVTGCNGIILRRVSAGGVRKAVFERILGTRTDRPGAEKVWSMRDDAQIFVCVRNLPCATTRRFSCVSETFLAGMVAAAQPDWQHEPATDVRDRARSAEHVQSFSVDDIEQFQRRAVGSFFSLLQFLDGRRTGVQVRGKDGLTCFVT